jgi:hypothetical protein
MVDHPRFSSLTDAFTYVVGHYALKEIPHIWQRMPSGLLSPRAVPPYLFRGECGERPATTHSLDRLVRAQKLSQTDLARVSNLVDWIAHRLLDEREGLDEAMAYGFIQHYGLPTRIIDFTGHLGLAFAFAAHGQSAVGRVAVMPYIPPTNPPLVVKLYDHPWADRAQKQAAYGLCMPYGSVDLKAPDAKSCFSIRWYEFEILPSERAFFEQTYGDLLREEDDPSAGFVRYYINGYVERFGKLSPELTDWLLEEQEDNRRRIPIAPYCHLVDAVDETGAVVYFRSANSLERFDRIIEAEKSRRYWSSDYADRSQERLQCQRSAVPGVILADPRTYHPESYQPEPLSLSPGTL